MREVLEFGGSNVQARPRPPSKLQKILRRGAAATAALTIVASVAAAANIQDMRRRGAERCGVDVGRISALPSSTRRDGTDRVWSYAVDVRGLGAPGTKATFEVNGQVVTCIISP